MPTQIKRVLVAGVLLALIPATAGANASRAHRAHLASARVPIAAGDLPGCLSGSLTDPRSYMENLHATVLRVVVSPKYGADGQALPCIRGARTDGYRTVLVVQWNSSWSLPRTEKFFRRILGEYRFYIWAIGIGNEQEITPHLTSAGYSRAWRGIEPIVKKMAPWAIRAGGEISPWGFRFISGALRDGLPGIQALAVHPYAFSWAFTPAEARRLARRYRLPLWYDEAYYDGPNTWIPKHSRSRAQLRGAALIGVWLA